MNECRKLSETIDFKTIVDTYNSLGKQAAVKFVVETYGIRYDTAIKHLRKESQYIYNPHRDRYVLKTDLENPFLSLEELENGNQPEAANGVSIDTNEIVLNLIKDKFFEMSKYMTLEQSSKKIVLNRTAAQKAGYLFEYL